MNVVALQYYLVRTPRPQDHLNAGRAPRKGPPMTPADPACSRLYINKYVTITMLGPHIMAVFWTNGRDTLISLPAHRVTLTTRVAAHDML